MSFHDSWSGIPIHSGCVSSPTNWDSPSTITEWHSQLSRVSWIRLTLIAIFFMCVSWTKSPLHIGTMLHLVQCNNFYNYKPINYGENTYICVLLWMPPFFKGIRNAFGDIGLSPPFEVCLRKISVWRARKPFPLALHLCLNVNWDTPTPTHERAKRRRRG